LGGDERDDKNDPEEIGDPNGVGDVTDDEDEEDEDGEESETWENTEEQGDGADNESVVESSVRGSPAPSEQGNWHSFESLMNETYPSKSKTVYLAAYGKFEQYLKSVDKFEPNVAPTETSLLNYFHFLKTVKFWAPTSIWSQYSRLNAILKRRFRVSLKSYPSVTDLLKSYEVGHRLKKSSVFTPQQASLYILEACLVK
jgi:hypothetical protein